MGSRRPDMAECAEYILKKCDEEYASAILFGNAVNIVNNKPVRRL